LGRDEGKKWREGEELEGEREKRGERERKIGRRRWEEKVGVGGRGGGPLEKGGGEKQAEGGRSRGVMWGVGRE